MAILMGVGVLAVAGRASAADSAPKFTQLTKGAEVTAIAWLPDGTIRFAERKGAIVDVAANGSRRRVVTTLAVNTEGQRGVLGLDTDRTGSTAISWVRKDTTMVLSVLSPKGVLRVVYEGRKSKNGANGGHILFEPDGKHVVMGLGDFLQGGKKGRFIRIDTTTSEVEELSVGWNNPFAFDWRDGPRVGGTIVVADNAPFEGPEEVAEINGRRFGPLPKDSTPSALAMTASGSVLEGVACSYVSNELIRYRFTPPVKPAVVGKVTKKDTLASDCSVAVRLLPDRRLVYATETHLMISQRPLP